MSGLALVVARTAPADVDAVTRMLAAVGHRGRRTSVSARGSVAVGACWDPDFPLASLADDGELVAVVSGTFDNATETDLASLAVASPDRNDAALLLAAYRRWGDGAVARLRGSFAGIITDGTFVVVFRDHFGCRPLYHHEGAGGWFVATEVKQVVAGAGLRGEPDLDHLMRVLYGPVHLSTAVRGVSRVPRASFGSGPATGRAPQFRRHWDPDQFVESLGRVSDDEARDGLMSCLDRATQRMLGQDTAVLLSGGLDSPAIAASALRATPLGPVRGVTAVYPEHPSVDERPWAEMISSHVGMPFHPYVAEAAAMDDVELWASRLDGPVDRLSIPECAAAYTAARRAGSRVVLNGEIAEYLLDSRSGLLSHLLYRGRWIALARQVEQRRDRGRPRYRIAREIAREAAPSSLMKRYYEHQEWWGSYLPAWLDVDRAMAVWEEQSATPWMRWRGTQTLAFGGAGHQMEAGETTGAYCGVDVRRPFTDVDLWQFVLGLPAQVKHGTLRPKQLLRDGLRGRLPDAHLDRTDKTLFDEFHLATIQYPVLKGLLTEPDVRLPGVDYDLLQRTLEEAALTTRELRWVRDLAKIHAYLAEAG